MDSITFREYCLAKPFVEEGFPFDEETLVFKVGGKIFALTALEKQPLRISLKGNPEKNVALREQYPQITGAYHMNKTHWNTLVCELLPEKLIRECIDESYDLVWKSLTKKQRDALLAL